MALNFKNQGVAENNVQNKLNKYFIIIEIYVNY